LHHFRDRQTIKSHWKLNYHQVDFQAPRTFLVDNMVMEN
jgi:hypothetical protein